MRLGKQHVARERIFTVEKTGKMWYRKRHD